MKKIVMLYRWILCLLLFFPLPAMAGQYNGGQYSTSDAQTVQGKAPAANNGLATLDSSGNLAQPVGTSSSCFYAYLSSSQTVTSVSTAYKVILNAKLFDPNNIADVSTNNRVTPKVPGSYLFTGRVVLSNSGGTPSNPPYLQIALYKNGAILNASMNPYPTNPNPSQPNGFGGANLYTDVEQLTPIILSMNGTTDYVELWGYVVTAAGTTKLFSGGAGTAAYISFLQGCRLGN